MSMDKEKLAEVLALHATWARGETGGTRANLADAYLAGATLREGLKAGRFVGAASRGDSYVFYAFETDAGELIYFAGCRAFLRSEYEKHIEAEYPGTTKAEATRACLDYLANLKAL